MRGTFEAETGAGTLAGWTEGAGQPVLLLHGGPGLGYAYLDEIAADIGDGFHLAGYQQRGLAPSTAEGPFSVGQEIADAQSVLDALGWERAFVVGHSWGGHLALRLAGMCPDRLLGALAIDPLGVAGDGGDAAFAAELTARAPEPARIRFAEIEAKEAEGLTTDAETNEALALLWPGYFADPESAPPYTPMAMSVDANLGIMKTIGEGLEDAVGGLASGAVPISILAGAGSPMPWGLAARASAELSPRSELTVIPHAGHFPWVEAPGCVREALERLVQ